MTRPALRPYQRKLKADVYDCWSRRTGPSNAGVAAATGSGKTVFFCDVLHEYQGYRGALVHRQELVSQISVTMGRYGLRHRIIAPPDVVQRIVSMQINEIGGSYHDPNAKCFVAGVDTFNKRPDEPYMLQCGLVVPDEAHHVLRENKWGQAIARLPNAYGLFPTATPMRADGRGLGRHADGLIDELILAPEMRDIIDMGYLTDYRLVLAESDVDISDVPLSADGDLNQAKLREAHHKSKKIVGDVVRTYLAYARGKLGLTFAVDIEEAGKIAAGFREAGVPAEVVTGKTDDRVRAEIIARFRRRQILQLVSVDIIGEGVDIPAVEVVSMARHTESFGLYVQQFGRALRLMIEPHLAARWDTFSDAERRAHIAAGAKPRAIIIDHVGNVMRHKGPPDATWRRGQWTLDRREKGARSAPSDAEPLRTCPNPNDPATGLPCAQPYERFRECCPYCGHVAQPAVRSAPEHVDGNMLEVDDAYLDALRRGVSAKLEAPVKVPYGATGAIEGRLHRLRHDHLQAVANLKNAAAWWSGLHRSQGYSDAEAHKRFHLKFGVDVWTAQTLDRQPVEQLHARLLAELSKAGIDGTVNAGVALTTY